MALNDRMAGDLEGLEGTNRDYGKVFFNFVLIFDTDSVPKASIDPW